MIKEAMLYEKTDDGKIHCYLCSHHCKISESQYGICGMRQNINDKLFTYAYGEVIAANIDPIEKKPLFHVLPGTMSMSIATAGCNFRCGFCQNWQISQTSKKRDPNLAMKPMLPSAVIQRAIQHNCHSISYTYTEPTIFFEYAYDIARLAKQKGLLNIFVTNGFMTPAAVVAIQPYLDAANVDLKGFNNHFYEKICHGQLQPVIDTITLMKELNIWVEITTLLIPKTNDSKEELADMARFIASVDKDMPWHISRFHPDYNFKHIGSTPIETLELAYFLGKDAGLRYVYIGNVSQGETPKTTCPECKKDIIERKGYWVTENNMDGSKCVYCHTEIAGVY
jgi:pyruvate formate lyase activating enzyme